MQSKPEKVALHPDRLAGSGPEGIERYLGSGLIKGVGPVYGKKLVAAFGKGAFDVIEQEPARPREVTDSCGTLEATA